MRKEIMLLYTYITFYIFLSVYYNFVTKFHLPERLDQKNYSVNYEFNS